MILISVTIVLTIQIFTASQITIQDSKYEVETRNLFDNILKDVSNMRGLSVPNGTELRIVSIQFFQEGETQKIAEESQEIKLEDLVYHALFLIPQNYSVGEAREEQAGRILSAVAGTRLYVVKEYFDPEDILSARRTLAHEITHILQYQFKPVNVTTFDRQQAWAALIEGDADFTADNYITTYGPQSIMYTPVPDSLDRINGFPYQYGSSFIDALYQKGGWSLVDSAYDRQPSSTEEVLHPGIYLTDGSSILVAALKPVSDGWDTFWNENVGEYFIRIMLENGVPSDIAEKAAEGWGGDNLTLFRRDDVNLVTWRIAWDTETDASEFVAAYRAMLRGMGAEEVEPNLYYLMNYYASISRTELVTEIVSSMALGPVMPFLSK
jgi:hypothetical protein